MLNTFHTVAIAGAGTGKTYSLVENYLSALFGLDQSQRKKRPQEILALTFTEKAAGEMRLRITNRLSELLFRKSSDDPLFVMAKNVNQDLPNSDEIRRILRAIPNAPIATFHGFCAQFLRHEAAAVGIDDRFEILSPKEEKMMARNVLRPIIISEINHNAIVRSLVARFRLGANFSSLGLVDGLLEIYFKLPEKNILCEDLEGLTRSRRVTKAKLNDDFVTIIESFHTFASISSSSKTRARLEEIARILDRRHGLFDQSEIVIANFFKDLRRAVRGNFGDKIGRQTLILSIKKLGDDLLDYFLLPDEVAIARLLTIFHDEFNKTKRDALKLSYADLLQLTQCTLRDNLLLRKKTKLRIQHILVDEYQDTSPIQQDIISLLSEDKSIEESVTKQSSIIDTMRFNNGSSLFVVGDQKQSIYGFRGADVSLFSRMIKKMEETHAQGAGFNRKYLTTNRRSSTRIIDLVNLVAEHSLSDQGYLRDHSLVPVENAADGECGLWVQKDDKNLSRTEANLICACFGIVQLLSSRKDVFAKDIVVLVRRIKSASIIKQQLSSFGIPSRIVGGEGFFEQQEVVDLLSALKLINDPKDQMASAVVFRSPLVLLLDQELFHIKNSTYGFNLEGALELLKSGQLSKSSSARLLRFASALNEARHVLRHDGLGKVIDILIDRCDFASALGLYDDAHQKWANVEKLKVMLMHMAKNPFVAIEDAYAHVDEPGKEPLAASGQKIPDAVTIMTIHQSKGLEFKVVVLADTESQKPIDGREMMVDTQGILLKASGRPIEVCAKSFSLNSDAEKSRYETSKLISDKREDEEKARLLYVALTRAKQKLFIASSFAGFTRLNEENNMLAIFLRAYRREQQAFKKICAIEFKEHPSTMKEDVGESQQNITAIFKKSAGPIRLFASNLSVSPFSETASTKWQNLVIIQRPDKFRPIDGALAHRLLQHAGVAAFNGLSSHHHIEEWLKTLMRSMGESLSSDVEPTLCAVQTTLQMLKESVPSFSQPIFEMALSTWPNARFLIEGFADVVIVADDFVGVVELKSSLKKVHDVNTYFQVLAYAHALRKQFHRPIQFAVALFGSSQKINWQHYDDDVRQLFLGEFSDAFFDHHDNISQEENISLPVELVSMLPKAHPYLG